MVKFKKFVRPDTLEEALKLNQGRANVVLGGTGWLKMGSRQWSTAIDLGKLGLDAIEETPEGWRIGAMVTLRQLECHQGLNAFTKGAIRDCVKHIVGVQFRTTATIGGSLWSRFGFSDILTCFMALDCTVVLAQGGEMPLTEFAVKKADNDILTHIVVKKTPISLCYTSFRNTETDIPVVAVAVGKTAEGWHACVGARPARSVRVEGDTVEALLTQVAGLTYGSNTRATGEYRAPLAQVLTRRCVNKLSGGEEQCC